MSETNTDMPTARACRENTMLHEPAPEEQGEDHAAEYKTKVGIRLFVIYAIVFAGFVIINTFVPEIMGAVVFMGLNLAITYGFFLIILAVVLGVIYNLMCTAKEKELNK